MKSLASLTWPDSFGRRFGLVMGIYQPVLFLAALLAGAMAQMSVPETMLRIWIWAFVIGLVVALMQALTAEPGQSIWRSTLFRSHE